MTRATGATTRPISPVPRRAPMGCVCHKPPPTGARVPQASEPWAHHTGRVASAPWPVLADPVSPDQVEARGIRPGISGGLLQVPQLGFHGGMPRLDHRGELIGPLIGSS